VSLPRAADAIFAAALFSPFQADAAAQAAHSPDISNAENGFDRELPTGCGKTEERKEREGHDRGPHRARFRRDGVEEFHSCR